CIDRPPLELSRLTKRAQRGQAAEYQRGRLSVIRVGLVRRRVIIFLASGAYLGYAPVASGTFGTLAGVALYPVFEALRNLSVPLYALTFCALVAAAIIIAGEAEVLFGEKDSGRITIDEIAGYLA